MEDETKLPAKHPSGRPSSYTQEKADEICAMIAEGKSIRTICAIDGMPETPTFYRWLRTYPEFLQQYTCAKQDQADALAEEMLDISDDGSNDWMETRNKRGEIEIVLDKEHVNRSRLRVETRKWIASKMKPKVYGEAALIKNQMLDKDGKPTDPVSVSADPILLAALEAIKKGQNHDNSGE